MPDKRIFMLQSVVLSENKKSTLKILKFLQ